MLGLNNLCLHTQPLSLGYRYRHYRVWAKWAIRPAWATIGEDYICVYTLTVFMVKCSIMFTINLKMVEVWNLEIYITYFMDIELIFVTTYISIYK
jgi:hypothetical protein